MVLASELKNAVNSTHQVYEENFDQEIDQSSIYSSIQFSFLTSSYPAVILTPVCSLYTDEIECVTVAQIISAREIYEIFLASNNLTPEQILGIKAVKKKAKANLNENFVKYYIKNRTHEYHFLPKKTDVIDHSFVNFEMVQTMPREILKKSKKIAALKSPWRESVPARYAAYCLRIGTPNYSLKLLNAIIEEITSLKEKEQ